MGSSAFGRRLGPALLSAAALGAAGCGDTLLDHRANPALLAPACSAGELACDGQCLTCSTPANAVPACVAGGCGFTCNGGYNACGGSTCVAESVTSCGVSCQDCRVGLPANAAPLCTAAHSCAFECNPGYIRSGATCQRTTAVSAGFLHTCALLADQTVRCWGANEHGELGDGTTADASVPVGVSLPGAATAVVASYAHSCAVVAPAGKVYCWGENKDGQAGNGSAALLEPNPVEVTGLTGVLGIGAGNTGLSTTPYGHTCAILADRSLKCWGAGTAGQLGDGGTASQGTPVAVTILPPGTQIQQVTGGERFTCASTTGGALYCWGENDKGQLGINSLNPNPNPPATTAIQTIGAGVVAIAAGDVHACAIVGTTVECWGFNGSGQVDATTLPTNYLAPHAVGGLGGLASTAVVLGTGRAHSCAQKAGVAEIPKCWGDNQFHQLANAQINLPGPFDVPLSPGAQAISGGSGHTCALTTDGGVQCWGLNDHGQLGRGTVTSSEVTPGPVSGR